LIDIYKTLFWLSSFLIINSYVIYYFLIKIITRGKHSDAKKFSETELPGISIIISAYNEENVIEERIKNILRLNYPQEKIEIIIGSDGSTDKTNEILTRFSEEIKNLKIFLYKDNRGKANVLNDLIIKSSMEFIVFTDANTIFDENAIRNLMQGYSNDSIGGVSGRLILKDEKTLQNESVEEKKYWEYETNLKLAEGNAGLLIGANGGIFSIRKKLFEKLPAKPVTDDLYISLNVLAKGYKFVYKYDAFATEDIGADVITEYKRKVRFAATNFQTLFYFPKLLFNKNLLISYSFWSHKVIRWFSPLLFFFLLILNILLINQGLIYHILFTIQILFYFAGLIGYFLTKKKVRIKLFSLPYFFIVTNIALLVGLYKFITKKHSAKWESTKRIK